MPFFLGLAVVAEPLVLVLLGDKWAGAIPLIRLLAIAMPFWTLFTLLQPATDAMGRPEIALRNAAIGALIMPVAFLVGGYWGIAGIAAAWIAAYPALFAFAAWRSLPVIGMRAGALLGAILPSVLVAMAMAVTVMVAGHLLAPVSMAPRLALLVESAR